MTQLYYSYKEGTSKAYAERESKKHPFVTASVAAALVLLVGATVAVNNHFDTLFPADKETMIS